MCWAVIALCITAEACAWSPGRCSPLGARCLHGDGLHCCWCCHWCTPRPRFGRALDLGQDKPDAIGQIRLSCFLPKAQHCKLLGKVHVTGD